MRKPVRVPAAPGSHASHHAPTGHGPAGVDPSREQLLEKIVRETLWMACRYAHGRQSYSVAMYNEAARTAVELNVVRTISLNGEPVFAIDGSKTREMSGLSQDEYTTALAAWFRHDAIPQHCRGDWLLRDSDGNPQGGNAVPSLSDDSAGRDSDIAKEPQP